MVQLLRGGVLGALGYIHYKYMTLMLPIVIVLSLSLIHI